MSHLKLVYDYKLIEKLIYLKMKDVLKREPTVTELNFTWAEYQASKTDIDQTIINSINTMNNLFEKEIANILEEERKQ